jgi:tRNA(Ile)-lysidine synthase
MGKLASTRVELSLEQKVLSFIQKQHLVPNRQKILVAVSGGPDSVCLLQILANLQKELEIKLHVAHLNHQLRGAESQSDAEYVDVLAHSLGIPATIESRDVNIYRARHHLSLEEAAREVRYSFLTEVAALTCAERVAIGHTIDDHVETILMHLIRGSGINGLRGLQSLSQWQFSGTNITIIRPLLALSHEETTAYCRHHNLHPHIDASNLSSEPLRNRIRHHLLPELRNYNPRINEALLRTARIAADDITFIDEEVVRLLKEITIKQKDSLIVDKKKFTVLPSSLKRHLLRAGIEVLLGNLKDIEASHIEDVMDALAKPAGKVMGLPRGLNFIIEYDKYVLGKDIASLCPFPVLEKETQLKIPGSTNLHGWNIEAATLSFSEAKKLYNKEDDFVACFDFDITGNNLIVRHHQPGDRFQPLGMRQPKKLNKFMIDAKIPQSWRRRIPIVHSPQNIIWVVGWRIDARAKVTDSTEKVLCLKFIRS